MRDPPTGMVRDGLYQVLVKMCRNWNSHFLLLEIYKHPICRRVFQFLKRFSIHLSYNPAIVLLGVHSKEIHIFLLSFKYSCLHFTPTPTLDPTPLWFCPRVLHTCSLKTLPLLSPIIPLPRPLWLLSVCSSFK